MTPVLVGSDVSIGGPRLVLVGGPCAIESEEATLDAAVALAAICADRSVPYVFKASFDKANRSSVEGFRGPGIERGLAVLQRVKEETGVPVTTDVHEPWQAAVAAEVVDLLQVPAFLCRQTDLLEACAATGKPVSVKKGQFMAPQELSNVVAKLDRHGASGVVLAERGSSFGYNNLVVDFRGLATMAQLGRPVMFDATHSVQMPGALGTSSGGQRQFVPVLARAAVAVGVDALFMEIHRDPDNALSDGPNMVPLAQLAALLDELLALDAVRQSTPKVELEAMA